MIPYVYNGDTVTLFLYGVPETIDQTHPNFSAIFQLLQQPHSQNLADEIARLLSVKKAIEEAVKGQTFGSVVVGNDCVLYNGQAINTFLTDRMLAMLAAGLDISPWALFMDKLYKNPSKTAVDELFLWLDKARMPITAGGNFLAYKKVNNDYTSFHKGKNGLVVSNRPGEIVSMPRNEVDDIRDRTCSAGLHFCSWDYLPHYYGTQGRVVLVEIDPADVVSIPSDYDNSKGRASQYTIVGEIEQSRTQHAFADTLVWTGW